MSEQTPLYSYRCGNKVSLKKNNQQFVARMSIEELQSMGYEHIERVSPSSCRVTLPEKDLEQSMSACRYHAPTHHAYFREENEQEFLITDRILITFKQALGINEVDAFAGKYGLIQLQKYNDIDYLFQLTNHTGMNPVKLVVKLTEEDEICGIVEHDLNWRVKKYEIQLPLDPLYNRQWHLHQRSNDPEFDPRSSSNVEEAWQLLDGFGSSDVVVGITDDGCLLSHPDFDSGNKFSDWGYFQGSRLVVSNDFDARPENMYQPGANHGTSVAGVIAGEIDATLTVGAAPGCRLLPIKWESNGPFLSISESKLMTAIRYLSDKADIMSNSWGSTPISEWSSQLLNLVRTQAISGGRRGNGLLFMWASGNENVPINHLSDIPLPFTPGWEFRPDGSRIWIGVETTRRFSNNLVGIPGVMHIAALASNAQRSHYSNFGTGIDVTASSSNGHAYFRMSVEGLGIVTTTGQAGGATGDFGGTSSATPLVAGIAALVISANPSLSALEIISLLRQSASKELDFTPYPRTPPTSFDPDTSWDISPAPPFDNGQFTDIGSDDGTWSPWFGYGKVDAVQAVAQALQASPPRSNTSFEKISTPQFDIPDNDTTGISDTINCPNTGRLQSIRISVDLTHTYRGDLILRLQAPSGKTAILHNRAGGSANNIQTTYTIANAPTLSTLIGEEVNGNWIFQVFDLAAQDLGRLHEWKLELEIDNTTFVQVSEAIGVTIPDNVSAGITRTLTVSENGQVEDIEIALDLTHTYIGDLTIAIISPDNTTVVLHNRTGGSNDNIIRTYRPDTTPDLQNLIGKDFNGSWQLRIIDSAFQDIGKLNRWSIRIMPA